MGRLDSFESRMEEVMDGAAGAVFKSSLNPVQITKKVEKAMYREKLVNAGRQYAPTLYSVILSPEDDRKLSGFYPTLAAEMETYLKGKASQDGLVMDGDPLVRFIADQSLKKGRFDVIAENVSAPIVAQLRAEEMERYGLMDAPAYANRNRQAVRDVRNVASEGSKRQYRDRYDEHPEYPDQGRHRRQDGFSGSRGAAAPAAAGAVYAASGQAPASARPTRPVAEETPVDYADEGYEEERYFTGNATLTNVKTGESYELTGLRVSVGRERGNNICIRDANISRSHAELIYDNGTWFIRDLGSTNGTQVNGHDVIESDLYDGDNITLGMTTLEFRMD